MVDFRKRKPQLFYNLTEGTLFLIDHCYQVRILEAFKDQLELALIYRIVEFACVMAPF